MAHEQTTPFDPAQSFKSPEEAVKLIMLQQNPHEALMAVLNANILWNEFGFSSELIQEYSCYQHTNVSAQTEITDRIKAMPDIEISMYWKEFMKAHSNFREHAPEQRMCKIGIYPENPTDDEKEADQDIFFYFESLDDVTQGISGECDFIVVAYTYENQTFEISDADIQKQFESKDPILNSLDYNKWRGYKK